MASSYASRSIKHIITLSILPTLCGCTPLFQGIPTNAPTVHDFSNFSTFFFQDPASLETDMLVNQAAIQVDDQGNYQFSFHRANTPYNDFDPFANPPQLGNSRTLSAAEVTKVKAVFSTVSTQDFVGIPALLCADEVGVGASWDSTYLNTTPACGNGPAFANRGDAFVPIIVLINELADAPN